MLLSLEKVEIDDEEEEIAENSTLVADNSIADRTTNEEKMNTTETTEES